MKGWVRLAVEIAEERRLYDILTGESLHIDALSREFPLSLAKALATLLAMEMKGVCDID